MAAAKKQTKQDLEKKIAALEAKLNRLSEQITSESAKAKPAEVKPAETAKPKPAETAKPKPAEVKPAETDCKTRTCTSKRFYTKTTRSSKTS